MKRNFNNVFFDLDGTISDSYKGIKNGFIHAFKNYSSLSLNDNEINSIIGIPLTESLKRYFDDNSKIITEVINSFREYYDNIGLYESEIYSGIIYILEELALESKIYVITAKPVIQAAKMLSHHNIAHLFTNIYGFQPNGINFSKTELIKQIPNLNKSIVIGDKQQDIEAGKDAGIMTGGVLYGYGTEEEILKSNPDFIIKTVAELKNILLS
ncbi:MAG: HAD hydrolase-like protein [Bacteroidales bacterium]|nr:HAD hydrolase-like protein [Bacteroidales bacterium]